MSSTILPKYSRSCAVCQSMIYCKVQHHCSFDGRDCCVDPWPLPNSSCCEKIELSGVYNRLEVINTIIRDCSRVPTPAHVRRSNRAADFHQFNGGGDIVLSSTPRHCELPEPPRLLQWQLPNRGSPMSGMNFVFFAHTRCRQGNMSAAAISLMAV